MSRLLVASYSVMGHYRTIVRLVQQLVGDGHEVMYVSNFPVEVMTRLGCQTRTLGVPHAPMPTGEDKARLVSDPEAVLEWQKWVRIRIVESHIEPFRALIREFRPELVAAEGQMYSAFLAAHLENVPHVSLFRANLGAYNYWLDTPLKTEVERLSPDRAALFRSVGLTPDFRSWEYVSPLLNVGFVTEELIGKPPDLPTPMLLAGPSIPFGLDDDAAFPWQRLIPGRPLVYVSFGSMNFWQPRLIRIVAEAAAPLGAQVVVACADMAETEHTRELPGDPIIVRVTPQPALLEKTSVFVSHAGAGSVMETCYFGVPMLAIPITSDQPGNAHLVGQLAQIGIAMNPDEVDVASCTQALEALIAERSVYRDNLAPIEAAYRARDGARITADALAQLVRR